MDQFKVGGMMAFQVALDIGGTFTDLVAFDDRTGELRHAKSSTTPDDLTLGIIQCLKKGSIPFDQCETFVHGATVAINTLIEQTGARTVLVTTAGARDVYLIGRGNRPEAYNVFFQRAKPLVPRSMIVEVSERLRATGDVLLSLTDGAIADVCRQIALLKPESIAVCLLHSYANPAHERKLGEALRKAFPNAYLSLSHEILRQFREYERTSTTVVNSYVGPRVSSYLEKLETQINAKHFSGTLLIMQSNGGVTSVASASRIPVTLMESGPVGGINASAELGTRLGFDRVISFDMGGTTAKTSLVRDGRMAIAEGYYVNGYASGYPIILPVVDIVEVGAGGGSIGWIDEVGGLKVGPRSAGASPGPVCYRLGGTEPTVTDANLVLGRINGERFLGGEMPLDVGASRLAIKEKLADRLAVPIEEVALGMLRIAVSHMTLAVRGVSIERGFDPRDFVMVASGGNGGLHAPLIARELSIPKVVIPVLPAHCSATGMLMTDLRHDYVRTYPTGLADADLGAILAIAREFSDEGRMLLSAEGIDPAQHDMHVSLDIRYTGQESYLNVPVSDSELAAGDRQAIRARFQDLHSQQYGKAVAAPNAEIVNVRVSAYGLRTRFTLRGDISPSTKDAYSSRQVYLANAREAVTCLIYDRSMLRSGAIIFGPAIIEEDACTVLLLKGDRASITPNGEIIIDIGGE
jgi:N-methylhydantoinase A